MASVQFDEQEDPVVAFFIRGFSSTSAAPADVASLKKTGCMRVADKFGSLRVLIEQESQEVARLVPLCCVRLGDETTTIKEKQDAAFALMSFSACPNPTYVQPLLDHLGQIKHACEKGESMIRVMFHLLLTELRKPPWSPVQLVEEHHVDCLLEWTPMPRDLVLLCAAYLRSPRMSLKVGLELLIQALRHRSQLKLVLDEDLIRCLLLPSAIVSPDVATALLVSIKDLGGVSFAPINKPISCELVKIAKQQIVGADYWSAWFDLGLLDALRGKSWKYSSVDDGETWFSNDASDLLELLPLLLSLDDPRVRETAALCLLDVLDHAPVALRDFPCIASAFIRRSPWRQTGADAHATEGS